MTKKPEGDVEQLKDFYYNTLKGGKIDKVGTECRKRSLTSTPRHRSSNS